MTYKNTSRKYLKYTAACFQDKVVQMDCDGVCSVAYTSSMEIQYISMVKNQICCTHTTRTNWNKNKPKVSFKVTFSILFLPVMELNTMNILN